MGIVKIAINIVGRYGYFLFSVKGKVCIVYYKLYRVV